MQIDYYDVCVLGKRTDQAGNVKEFWTKIGVAFPARGGKVSIKLEAQPLGGFTADTAFMLFPKESKVGQRGPDNRPARDTGPAPTTPIEEDDIPF